jgi:hypothetical protein
MVAQKAETLSQDMTIPAHGTCSRLTLATRNLRDFEDVRLELFITYASTK